MKHIDFFTHPRKTRHQNQRTMDKHAKKSRPTAVWIKRALIENISSTHSGMKFYMFVDESKNCVGCFLVISKLASGSSSRKVVHVKESYQIGN